MFYLQELETLKRIIREGRGFQGRSDQKMRIMWLGQEIVVAMAFLPCVTPGKVYE